MAEVVGVFKDGIYRTVPVHKLDWYIKAGYKEVPAEEAIAGEFKAMGVEPKKEKPKSSK